MFDWLIVGGGLQGSFVAGALAHAASAADIAVLDTRGPLDAWQRRAAACGMQYLRSPGAHHLGRRADSLRAFATRHDYDAGHQLGYYRRPSRALFEAHAETELARLPRIRTAAHALEYRGAGWTVHDAAGRAHHARRVVLALGPGRPLRPGWAAAAEHVYDPGFAVARAVPTAERVAVVGGGITGAQLALRYRDAGHAVSWITRRAPRRTPFDSAPCYAGRLCLEPFARVPIDRRTRLLAAARQPGTLPPDVYAQITAALAAGEIGWRCGTIRACGDAGPIFANGVRLAVDRVVLATGFENRPAPNSLLEQCRQKLGLRLDRDGHVFIDPDLAAAPGLHVTGRPASLELGPMAGNIRGARLAGKRLAAFAGAADCGGAVRRA